jgi:HEAT repeat protein
MKKYLTGGRKMPERASLMLSVIFVAAVSLLFLAPRAYSNSARGEYRGEEFLTGTGQLEAQFLPGDPVVRLIKTLKYNPSPEDRVTAAQALGEMGDLRAVEPLVVALGDQHLYVRAYAAESLAELGDARAVEPLICALGDEVPFVRAHAAQALGELGDARAVGALLKALTDGDADMRAVAAWALGELDASQAVEPLIGLLGDRDAEVRVSAACSLGNLGDRRAAGPLARALEEEDDYVKKKMKEALAMIEASGP